MVFSTMTSFWYTLAAINRRRCDDVIRHSNNFVLIYGVAPHTYVAMSSNEGIAIRSTVRANVYKGILLCTIRTRNLQSK